jgi:CelD/BcsL family acetyltransferase involved in cellulose biosynthesis
MVEVITSLAEFEELRDEWDSLVRRCAVPSPYSLHGWLAERWRHVSPSAAVVVARRDDRIVSALPLALRDRRGLHTAHLLGGVYPGVDLLLDGTEPNATAAAVLDVAAGLGLDYASFWGFQPGSVLDEVLDRKIARHEWEQSPVLDLTRGWEAVYREKRSSKGRSKDRRGLRRLEELGPVEIRVARTREELLRALDAAFEIHAARWSSHPRLRDRSRFTSEPLQAFQRGLVARPGAEDVIRILVLRAGGKPIAFVYYFVLGGAMIGFRLGFDPAAAQYSPGRVALLAALEEAAGEGVSWADYGIGTSSYKLELADRVVPTLFAHGLHGTLKGRVASRARLLKERLGDRPAEGQREGRRRLAPVLQ